MNTARIVRLKIIRIVAAIAVSVVTLTTANAEPVHGRVFVQVIVSHNSSDSLAAAFGEQDRNDLYGDLRLTWNPSGGPWRLDVAYEATVVAGDEPGYKADVVAVSTLPASAPNTAWDATDTLVSNRHLSAVQKMDRLSVGYSGAHLILRAGRQALTWGSGLVFHPMDLFDPFSPDATDTEFKPGTDMLYGQYLFDSGADLQAVVVPRPLRRGGRLNGGASSAALLFQQRIGPLQTSWLLARDREDTVAGIAVAGTLRGATWSTEVMPTFLAGGGTAISALLNVSDAGTLWGHNITYFAELYRNGFGVARTRVSLGNFSADLIARQQRGQVFATARDVIALGATVQISPLIEASPTLIANLDDTSAFVLAKVSYSLADNLVLVGGVQLPIGPNGTEFGGVALQADGPPYVEPPTRAYLQIRRYF